MAILIITVTFYLKQYSIPQQKTVIEVGNALIFKPQENSNMTAIKMDIHNNSAQKLIITGIKSSIFTRSMLHHTDFKSGKRVMSKLNSIMIKPGATQIISPNGVHFMVFDLKRDVNIGELLPMVLTSNQGDIKIIVKVIKFTLH